MGDWSRVIVKVPGTRNFEGTLDLPFNWIKVANGTSGNGWRGVPAFGEPFLSIEPSTAGRRRRIARYLAHITYRREARWGSFSAMGGVQFAGRGIRKLDPGTVMRSSG